MLSKMCVSCVCVCVYAASVSSFYISCRLKHLCAAHGSLSHTSSAKGSRKRLGFALVSVSHKVRILSVIDNELGQRIVHFNVVVVALLGGDTRSPGSAVSRGISQTVGVLSHSVNHKHVTDDLLLVSGALHAVSFEAAHVGLSKGVLSVENHVACVMFQAGDFIGLVPKFGASFVSEYERLSR
mmetsp:Transcript_32166/g.49854  ORF Transcript_32166/g.49854 Transcript_32166/m.49854 type:complete len:183 (+) Transcript_32166:61-609(+)